MPVTLQVSGLKYKNSQGQFQSADCLKGEDVDVTIFAPDYGDLTFPIAEGTLCTHSEKLYSANQEILTSEVWTAAHWDEISFDEIVSALKQDITGKADLEDIAPAFNAERVGGYAVGELCTKDGTVYVCTTAHTGVWNADHFAATNIGEQVTGLKNALSKSSENTNIAISAHPVGDLFWYNGTLHVATSAIAVGDTIVDSGTGANCKDTTISEAMIRDIQIDGTSILTNGVANIPIATNSNGKYGAVKGDRSYGIDIGSSGNLKGVLIIYSASTSDLKQGVNYYRPLVAHDQHIAIFYGFAKAAGADMKDIASTTVGQYPEAQKSAISQMLNGAVQVTGTTPVINAKAGIWYVCGECATLDIVAPESGCCDITFTSGSTPTVLTVTSAKANTTIKWANGFDPTALEANTTYEISIKDGELGAALSWT